MGNGNVMYFASIGTITGL